MAARIAAVAAVAAAGGSMAQQWPEPLTWPSQHTHREIMFTPSANTVHNKQVWYDFTNRALRYDIQLMTGPEIPLVTLLNFTSLWLNDTLFMYTYAVPLDNTPNCVALDMGFGIMYPDWFKVGANETTIVWASRKADGYDAGYHRTLLNQKNDGVSADPFSYFSYAGNETAPCASWPCAGNADGAPFRMSAPSPSGLVVNEYSQMVPASFVPNDPVFAQPAGIVCLPVNTTATSAAHAVQLLAQSAAPHLAHAPLDFIHVAAMDATTGLRR